MTDGSDNAEHGSGSDADNRKQGSGKQDELETALYAAFDDGECYWTAHHNREEAVEGTDVEPDEAVEMVRRGDAERLAERRWDKAWELATHDAESRFVEILDERIEHWEGKVEEYTAFDQVNLNDAKARLMELKDLRDEITEGSTSKSTEKGGAGSA